MRFNDVRQVAAATHETWAALHDPDVLLRVIPGCHQLTPLEAGRYAAVLAAQVGRLADTYRGTFTIADVRAGSELVVRMDGRGRSGRLEVELQVRLDEGSLPRTTSLEYDARARVGGLVGRLGRAPLTVAAGHLTGCFFRDLDRAMARGYSPVGVRSAL